MEAPCCDIGFRFLVPVLATDCASWDGCTTRLVSVGLELEVMSCGKEADGKKVSFRYDSSSVE